MWPQLRRRLARPPTPLTRSLSLSHAHRALKDYFLQKEDMHKRPSQLEIREKQLPQNTPTLLERVKRDREYMFFQYDRKHGYYKGETGTWRDEFTNLTLMDIIRQGYQASKEEFALLKEEIKYDRLSNLPELGDSRQQWQFATEEDMDKWVVTADSDWGEGYSSAKVELGPTGKAVFSGELSTRVPQDGRTKQAGYVNLASVKQRASFGRPKDLEWYMFSDLTLRLRGDGRTYRINLHTDTEFDVEWNDLWNYPLYTRGGPYWQTVKIPFSKFYFSAKGSMQDKQQRVDLTNITGLSITLADRADGPFRLELDEIGLYLNENYLTREKLAYETYLMPTKYFLNPGS